MSEEADYNGATGMGTSGMRTASETVTDAEAAGPGSVVVECRLYTDG